MAGMQLVATVRESGPLFDGTAIAAMHEGTAAVRHRLARDGERITAAAFAGMIRNNHGVFLSTITSIDTSRVYEWGGDGGRKTYTMPVVVDDPGSETIVTTELATYGPWLEGTGSRNQTTRFKGYHGFRLAAQRLNATARETAETELMPYVARCND